MSPNEGYDTHTNTKGHFVEYLPAINTGFKEFHDEMVAQGMWDKVTVVAMSEFGRCLVSNGKGTDHGWGGNMWMMGGKVNGGKIHGQFPDDLKYTSPNSRADGSRARMVPKHSWEALWHGIAQNMGVKASQMDKLLPNKINFPADQLFSKEDLFQT